MWAKSGIRTGKNLGLLRVNFDKNISRECLDLATCLEDLKVLPGNRLHPL